MKLYIRHFIILSFLILTATNTFAQGQSKKERIEQLKIAFITQELDLGSDEAEKFWPIYNQMAIELKTEKKVQRKLSKQLKEDSDSLSEKEFELKSLEIIDSQLKTVQLRREYHVKIAGIIGYKKATKLLSLEQRFKRELLNRVNGQRKTENRSSENARSETGN